MGERPLTGKRIVVTRPAEQAEALAGPLENLGAEVLLVPTIRIVPVPLNDEIRATLARLESYQLVVFTSVNGVAEFFGRMRECGVSLAALAGATVAAIGPRTAAALAAQGVEVGIVPEDYVAEGLLAALGAAGGPSEVRVLLARAREAREVLPDTLREWGATVDVLPVYETVPVERLGLPVPEIAAADYLTFTAASTVRRFAELAAGPPGEPLAERLAGARIASIGPATSAAACALGLTVAVEASDHDMHGLVSAILADVASRPSSA